MFRSATAAKKTSSSSNKKSAAPVDGDKKKRKKVRKETYSSYIYKGTSLSYLLFFAFDIR